MIQTDYFFEQNNTTMRVGLRSFVTGAAVTTYVDQDSWNIDKMDGTGTSDILVLAVQRLTGTSETFYASLGWSEVQ